MKNILVVVKYALFNPRNFIRLLSRIPYIIRGLKYAQNWNVNLNELEGLKENHKSDAENQIQQIYNKNIVGPGVWKWAHYLDIYDRYLKKFVGKKMSLVEIGVFSGGSLGMWQNYFGENSFIHGVDIEEACKVYESEKIAIHIGDQGDRNFWKKFKQENKRADIIIDDGGHHWEQQIITLEELLPWLNDGGVYICEDIHGDIHRFRAYCEGLAFYIDACDISVMPADSGLISQKMDFQRDIYSIHSYGFLLVIEKSENKDHQFMAKKNGTEWQPFLK